MLLFLTDILSFLSLGLLVIPGILDFFFSSLADIVGIFGPPNGGG